MRNRFAGLCYQCGTLVAPGEGHFERFRGRWRVHHVSCTLIHRDNMSPQLAKRIQDRKPKQWKDNERK